MNTEEFVKECESLSEEYFKLAKAHTVSVWGQAFYMGVSNTFIQVANALTGNKSPRVTFKEKLMGNILGETPNYLNANCASEQFYGSEEKEIAFEANQDRQVLKKFFSYCEKNQMTPSYNHIENYINWEYYDTSEEE